MSCMNIPIVIDIEETDVAAVMVSFDKIQIHRSTSGEGGPYSEITDIHTRISLEAHLELYRYEDADGSEEYWYKFRYFNSTTLAADSFSDAAPGAPHPALQIISIQELLDIYLFGIDLTDDSGNPYPTNLYAHSIRAAVDWIEKKLDIPVLRKRYEDERYDYIRDEYGKYIWLDLDRAPVIGVEKVDLYLPGDQLAHSFDQSWFQIQRFNGHIQMLPGSGDCGTILLGANGAWMPFIYGASNMLPGAFRVTYEAGFGRPSTLDSVSPKDPDLDSFPDIIKELVGKVASFGPLNIAGDLLGGAGIASVSLGLDGLSQSYNTTSSATNAGYGARITQYNRELKDMIPTIRKYYHGPSLSVI